MVKPKIIGLSKQTNRVSVILKKEQKFINSFRKFLFDLHFEEFDFPCHLTNCDENKCTDDEISNMMDENYWFRNDEFDVDLVLGQKKYS